MRLAVAFSMQALFWPFPPLKLGSVGPHEISPATASVGLLAAAATVEGLGPTTARICMAPMTSMDVVIPIAAARSGRRRRWVKRTAVNAFVTSTPPRVVLERDGTPPLASARKSTQPQSIPNGILGRQPQ